MGTTIQGAIFLLSERTRTASRFTGVPMKGNNMTDQNKPGQQNQSPGQKPAQQQGGGQKPGQQSQSPAKGEKSQTAARASERRHRYVTNRDGPLPRAVSFSMQPSGQIFYAAVRAKVPGVAFGLGV
jgi:hypothetical protein